MEKGAIILAGGKSTRMGTNKALLQINNKAVIEMITERLNAFSTKTIIVANEEPLFRFLQLPIIQDEYKEMGPLAGLHAGLHASNEEVNLVTACDMPFISANIAQVLFEKSNGFDAVIPVISGRMHPLFGIYRKGILPTLKEKLDLGDLKVKSLLDAIKVRFVDEHELLEKVDLEELQLSFFNMNLPSDYKFAKGNF